MLVYRINKLAPKRRASSVALPIQEGSLGLETTYRKALRQMIRSIAKATNEQVIPVVERELYLRQQKTAQQASMVQDADFSVFEQLSRWGDAFARVASDLVNRVLQLEAQRHTKKFLANAKKALSIDLSAVVREEDLSDELETIATRNAGLIKGLAQTTVQRVQQTVTRSVLSGQPVRELKKQLAADFAFSDRRAALIARDQTAKLTSDLNRIRHKQAGIEHYTWRTSQDERVRPLHRRLNGRVYRYDEPTDAEQGLHPGQPINCRCVAIAIVEFD